MARKRKRKEPHSQESHVDLKRIRITGSSCVAPRGRDGSSSSNNNKGSRASENKRGSAIQQLPISEKICSTIHHPVLSHYFQTLVSLRIWLLHILARRAQNSVDVKLKYAQMLAYTSNGDDLQDEVTNILDSYVVGWPQKITIESLPLFELVGFEDGIDDASAGVDGLECSQSELVSRVLNKLFRRRCEWKFFSVLTLGYTDRQDKLKLQTHGANRLCGAEVVNIYPNVYVTLLRGQAWSVILNMLGEEAAFEVLTMQGITEGGIFIPIMPSVDESNVPKCYHQMAGTAISELNADVRKQRSVELAAKQQSSANKQSLDPCRPDTMILHSKLPRYTPKPSAKVAPIEKPTADLERHQKCHDLHKPTTIKFVKTRIFFAKPALNDQGEVKFGLRHIHALNRFSNPSLRAHKVRLLKYIFPREFGLHNVFTGIVDRKQHTQPHFDYTLREQEIIFRLRRSGKIGQQRNPISVSASFAAEAEERALSDAGGDDAFAEEEEVEAFNLDNCPNGIAAGNAARHAAKTKARRVKDQKSEALRLEIELAERSENLPSRLRGKVVELIEKLITRQQTCSYDALIKHYCPVLGIDKGTVDKRAMLPDLVTPKKRPRVSLDLVTQFNPSTNSSKKKRRSLNRKSLESSSFVRLNPTVPPEPSQPAIAGQDRLIDFASSTGEVSAFVAAVIKKVIPAAFWGEDQVGFKNLRKILAKVNRFIKLRQSESMTLHDVMQDLKLTDFPWLAPDNSSIKVLSPQDLEKRKSLFSEFLYYLFDSLIIPLLRAHFYITDSSTHSMRVFYFRHDIWRLLTEPKVNELKLTHFDEMKTQVAKRILASRKMGSGVVRFLPKEKGLRIITNLRKKEKDAIDPYSKRPCLGTSVNDTLKPLKGVLKYEKGLQPQILGASLFSIGDAHAKLKTFKKFLTNNGLLGKQKLYFAKVDITAAYDTIPQSAAFRVASKMLQEDRYKIEKRCEISITDEVNPRHKWKTSAKPGHEFPDMEEMTEEWMASNGAVKKFIVFADKIVPNYHETSQMQDLLQEHICNNIVKIGKKYYHQKIGIPQGSVLSTMLCNLFYADLERKHLGFTTAPTGILLRLTDDFLFITLDRSHATRFLQIMHGGLPEYGAQVKLEKSLVNFEASIDGNLVKRVYGSEGGFPYAGVSICEKTLDVKREPPRKMEIRVADTMTVDYTSAAGSVMQKKIVNGFQIQARAMFFDTSFNTRKTVFGNIFMSFCNVAMKIYRYSRSLHLKGTHVNEAIIIKIINDLTDMIVNKLKDCAKQGSNGNAYVVGKAHIRWLSATAFKRILGRKQTLFKIVLGYLDQVLHTTQVERACRRVVKSEVVKTMFEGVRY